MTNIGYINFFLKISLEITFGFNCTRQSSCKLLHARVPVESVVKQFHRGRF